MASVKTLLDERGATRGYRVRWRDSAGHSRCETFPLGGRADADRLAVKVERDKHTGSELDRRGETLTVSEWRKEWQAVQSHREGTRLRVDYALAPLEELLGGLLLTQIRPSHVKAWKKARLEQVKAATVRAEWTWIKGLFAAAVADRLIPFNPCDGISIERGEKRSVVVAEDEHVTAIAADLPAHYRFLGPLGADTGLRPAELLGLHVEQIDFLRLSLTVDRQLVRGEVQFMPKTSSSRRTIPLIEETVTALSAHLAAFPAGPGGLVFHRPDGTPLSHRSVCSTWAAAAARAGIPGLRLHDMRHYYATSLLRQGLDIVEVSHLLGHARPSITADIYAHIQSDHEDRAREALRRVFGTRHQVVTAPSVQAKSAL